MPTARCGPPPAGSGTPTTAGDRAGMPRTGPGARIAESVRVWNGPTVLRITLLSSGSGRSLQRVLGRSDLAEVAGHCRSPSVSDRQLGHDLGIRSRRTAERTAWTAVPASTSVDFTSIVGQRAAVHGQRRSGLVRMLSYFLSIGFAGGLPGIAASRVSIHWAFLVCAAAIRSKWPVPRYLW